MLGRKKRAFLLGNSLHATLLEMMPDGVGMEGLIGDVGKRSGDLNSIVCLLRGDKVDSMANVDIRKLGWTTTRRLVEVRTLSGRESRDGSNTDTKIRGNRASGLTSIKSGEDVSLLGS